MKVELYIGDSKLDLFDDEIIELNSSVVDIENIENNTTEFTKDFTVPASNNNNRLFKHYYNADIDNGFDARVKVDGKILLNGFPFKLGKYRLSKVIVKNNKPSSYTIQFWGNLLNLKDILGNAELSDLSLSYYDHFYNSDVVKNGLQSSFADNNLIYNLFTKRQYYYNSDTNDSTNTDKLTNIAYNFGSSNGIKWNELRPSLRLIEIIIAIELYTGLKFSRDFFNRSEFYNLFLWLSPDADKKTGGDSQIINWNSGNNFYVDLDTNIGSFETSNTPAINDDINWNLYLKIIPSLGNENIEYTVKFYKDGELSSEIKNTGTKTMPKYSLKVQDANENPHTYNCYFEVETSQDFIYSAELKQVQNIGTLSSYTYTTYASENNIVSFFKVSDELPKIKVIDFLKGLFKMFKLVVIPVSNNEFYVNTLVDYYANGTTHDITNYVDTSSYEVKRGNLLNEINFTFEEPTTILNVQYEKNNNRAYGDEENTIKDDETGKLLDGESLDFKVPFEQIVYERLIDKNTNDAVNVQYGLILDEALESANPKAHIFYNINIPLGTSHLGFINDTNSKDKLIDNINIPSHTMTLYNPEYSTIFHEEINEFTYAKITKTLYSNYHKDYIDSIFNPKRRDYKFNAKLPFKILNKLQLNDTLKIKENYYRINDYNLNLLNGVTELNLISSFDKITSDFKSSITSVLADYKAQILSIFVNNFGTSTIQKVDSGFGVDWCSVTDSYYSGIVYFSFAYNDTGFGREMFVDIVNSTLNKTIRIYVSQSSFPIAALDFSKEENIVYKEIILT